jgi:transposase
MAVKPQPVAGRHRELVALLHVEHLTIRAAAKRMGITRRTAETYVMRIAERCPGDGPALRKVLRWADVLLAEAA